MFPQRQEAHEYVSFLARAASALLFAQILCTVLCYATGTAVLDKALCLFSAVSLLSLLKKQMSCTEYRVFEDIIEFEKRIAGRSVMKLEIPVKDILTIRPHFGGERTRINYEQVTFLEDSLKPTISMKLAYFSAYFSARLARHIMKERAFDQSGYVLAYISGTQRMAAVFGPDPELCRQLQSILRERWDWDDRLARKGLTTLQARCLQRAFPALYPNVDPIRTENRNVNETG